MTPSGVHINKPLVGLIVGGFILVIVGYKYSDQITGTIFRSEMAESVNPDDKLLKEAYLTVQVDGNDLKVHYRQAEPDVCSLDVLFLHGAAFKSQTWIEKPMWSLQTLSKLGYNVVAIDLPGYGNSPKAHVDPSRYLEAVIKGLKLNKPVIISPSMSGGFSLPYIFGDSPKTAFERARGFVPVAPVDTEKYKKEDYEALKIPTLIIYGELDTGLGQKSYENLRQIPGSQNIMYKGAKHPAYLHKPEEFHSDLHNFFQKILNSKET